MVRSVFRTFFVFAGLAGWDIFLQYNHPGADALHSKLVISLYVIVESFLYGTVFAGLHLAVGRHIRYLYIPIYWCIVAVELIETFINLHFGMTIKGE